MVRVEDTSVEMAGSRWRWRSSRETTCGMPVTTSQGGHGAAAGSQLGAAELGVLASVGVDRVSCARRPRLGVLTTGDELLEPGDAPRPGGVRNSNAYTIPALARAAGADVIGARPWDDPSSLGRDRSHARADVAVICGGVSVGEHDHVKAALDSLGVDEVFWRVALKPGKPTWFGVARRNAGLRPAGQSGLGDGHVPALRAPGVQAHARGGGRGAARPATLDEDLPKPPGRAHAVRCRLELRDDGWHAAPPATRTRTSSPRCSALTRSRSFQRTRILRWRALGRVELLPGWGLGSPR